MTQPARSRRPTKAEQREHLETTDKLRSYELTSGARVMCSAQLAQGDTVVFMTPPQRGGLFGREKPPQAYSGKVMDAGMPLETQIARGALSAVSAILKDPRCRGVGVTDDNTLVIALDLSLYTSLKSTCGQGLTRLPVPVGEHFRHDAFTFVVAGLTDFERGIGNA